MYTKCIIDPSTDIMSNIANINIGEGMDVDGHTDQAGALSGGMCLSI